MKKIETLTEAQIAKFPEYVKKWINIGLSTENPDRAKSEAAIKKVYQCGGKAEPKTFIWVESPFHAGVCYALLKSEEGQKLLKAGKQNKASVGDSVRASVRDSVWDSVWASVWTSVRASVRDSVWASVGDSVGASVGDSVRDSVGASVGDSVWASVGASVGDSCYGSHDTNWLAFYSYMQTELGIDCSKLNGFWEAAENCGWFIPFENAVIVSPKPYQIRTKLNARGNHILHADGEPAVFYCDDFKIYAREGIRLPEKYGSVKAENWKSEWFIEEKNVEIKRLIAEALGYENLFNALNAKEISKYREYKLFRAENVDVEPMHILTMTCPSTNKTHYGRVPPEIISAREAATWRNHGIEPESFLIEQ